MLDHSKKVAQFTTVENHFGQTYAIWHMNDKAFRKFYEKYTGDSLDGANNDEIFEARILLVKMLLDLLLKDCEVIIDEIQKENPL